MFLYWLLNPVLFCFVLDFSKLFISLAIQHPSKLPVCRESQNRREAGPTLYPRGGGAAPSFPHWSPECGNETGDHPSVEMNQDQVLPPTPVSASRAHAPCRQSLGSKPMAATESELSGGSAGILLVVPAPPGTSYPRCDSLRSATQPPLAPPGSLVLLPPTLFRQAT